MSYVLSLQNIQRHFYDNRKTAIFFIANCISAIPTVAIVESEMSLHKGQVKKLLRGQIIIAKVTLERAHSVGIKLTTINTHVYWMFASCGIYVL